MTMESKMMSEDFRGEWHGLARRCRQLPQGPLDQNTKVTRGEEVVKKAGAKKTGGRNRVGWQPARAAR
jgi:hypothetical protein